MDIDHAGRQFICYDQDGINDLVTSGVLTQAEAGSIIAQAEIDAVLKAREARYKAETDGMYLAAQYSGDAADMQAWKDAVAQIKLDLPKPI
ncbi:MAG: hypothetical protein CO175_01155 [Verrucomicrobia bacterium CG_4_9_14_3_um_filter_43_20]|nr:MAG: hypothetical protein CO175_01155 [Verrucomicrobia bacterium CG_4_9_14_3_um_filter_43_20]